MLTVVFYSNEGAAAKARSRAIAATRGDHTRVIDVSFWDGEPIKCDQVEIMPDVLKWQRKRITEVFGEVQEVEQQEKVVTQEPERKPMGLMPEKKPELPNPAAAEVQVEKKAVHKGGGRWFVMQGEERLSGPHDKAEALRLVEAA